MYGAYFGQEECKSHNDRLPNKIFYCPSVRSDADNVKTALDRIVIPQEALDRIGIMLSPRSSLIISDEPSSAGTGKDTEFVVVLSASRRWHQVPRRGSGIEIPLRAAD